MTTSSGPVIHNRCGCGEHDVGPQDCLCADVDTLDDDAARPNEGAIFDDHWACARGLEHPTNTDPT